MEHNIFIDIIEKLINLPKKNLTVSIGFDGYIDEIISAVDFREDINTFTPIKSISQFSERIADAAGKSTNIELYTHKLKFGGNGPILGNSIAYLGADTNYIGALGQPEINDVFKTLHPRFEMISIDNPGYTKCVEFEDGKIMFGQIAMNNITWNSIIQNTEDSFLKTFFYGSNLLCMVNWTQTHYMSNIWDQLLKEYLPQFEVPQVKPYLFIDLSDPQKRSTNDITYMLSQLSNFEKFYQVILGLNEKESFEIAKILSIPADSASPQKLQELAQKIKDSLHLTSCVIHPVKFAVCAFQNNTFFYNGPYTEHPLISTGAGDHFNAGFCFGLISGFTPLESLIIGVSNSGYYVRTGKTPAIKEITQFINDWKNKKI